MPDNENKDYVTISFRTGSDKRDALDQFAKAVDRDRTYILNAAIDCYMSMYGWQIQQIDEGTRAVKAGDFLSDAEIQSAIKKWSK